MNAGKTLLVIGGSGFFGKSFLDAHRRGLLRRWDVTRLIALSPGVLRLRTLHPELLDDSVTLVAADIGTASAIPAADYVIHAASSSNAERYRAAPLEERANILRSVENYARRAPRGAKTLYTSSGAVYGAQPSTLAQIDEDAPLAAAEGLVAYKQDYAEAKRLAEQRLAELGQSGAAVTVARCFAFVGRYLPRDQHFAIGNFIADGLAGRPVRVHAQHAVIRSYMHADDLVCWLMTMVDHADPSCPIYNVGSDEALTMGDIARTVAHAFGVAADVPPLTSPRIDRYVPSIARARARLGLNLNLDLGRAVEDVRNGLRDEGRAQPTSKLDQEIR